MRRWRWILMAMPIAALLTAAAHGQFRYDLTVSTSRDDPFLDVIVLSDDPTQPPAFVALNVFEFFYMVGTQVQARRAATVYFIPFDPATGNPLLPIIFIDPSQLPSGTQERLFPLDIYERSVIAPDPSQRVVLLVSRALAIRLDNNGNVVQQQGNVEITINDFRDPNQPDGIDLYYYEGSRENPTFEYRYSGDVVSGNLFVHRRLIP